MSDVKIIRLSKGAWRRGKGWSPAFLVAEVEGHIVRCSGNGRGWDCACGNLDCEHLDAAAAHVHEEVLTELELDDDSHLRPARPPQPLSDYQRRRRSA